MVENRIEKKNSMFLSHHLFVLCMMFFSGLNFFNAYFYWVFIAFFLMLLPIKVKFRINKSVVTLFFLCISTMVVSISTSLSITALFKSFVYILCYLMGYNLLREGAENRQTREKRMLVLLVIFAVANLTHLLLNWFTNLESLSRNTIDFWTGVQSGATTQMAISCLVLSLSIATLFLKTKWQYKLLAATALMAVLMYSLVLAGRTTILMTLICLIICVIYRLISSERRSERIKLLLRISVLFVILIFVYNENLFGIRDMVESSNLYNRFFVLNAVEDMYSDTRWGFKQRYIAHMWDYPFGGGHIHDLVGNYAHDMFLDAYDFYGIFTFAALVLYAIQAVVRLVSTIRNPKISDSLKLIVVVCYAVIYVEFFIEPVLAGVPWLFATFCIIDGSLSCLLEYTRKYQS